MKKVMLFVFSLLLPIGLFGQWKYEAGIRTGANLSTQTISGVAADMERNWIPGFHGGAFGTLFYTEKLAGQLEVIYSMKGSEWSDPSFSGREVLSYLDVPLLVRYQVLGRMNIHAGPQFCFLAGAWQQADGGIASNVIEFYEPVDVGLVVGVELNLSLRLNLAVRYMEGFSETTDPKYYTYQLKNRALQLSLSVAIFSDYD